MSKIMSTSAMNTTLKELLNEQYKKVEELKEENRKLQEEVNKLRIELVEVKWNCKKWTPSTPYIV